MSENDNPNRHCEDCGHEFLLKTSVGPCNKCEKLKPHKLGSDEYKDLEKYPQCTICGVTRRNGMTAASDEERCCGSAACKKIMNQKLGKPDSTPEAHNALADATRKRFRLDSRGSNLPAGTQLTTTELMRHQNGGGEPGEPQIAVAWMARLKGTKSTDTDIGTYSKRFARSVPMPEVVEDLCSFVNISWTKTTDRPKLTSEDVQIRFSGNKVPLPNTGTLSVGDFYNTHMSRNAAWFFDNSKLPAPFKCLTKNTKVPLMALELYIDTDYYHTRMEQSGYIQESASTSTKGKGSKKRTTGTMDPPSTLPASKRSRVANESITAPVSTLPKSTFRPSQRTGSLLPVETSTVKVEKQVMILDPVTWETSLEVAKSDMQVRIRDIPYAKGTMKLVFDVTLPGDTRMVAKRFFKLSEEAEESPLYPLNVQEANAQIQAEYTRLVLGTEFLKSFLQSAKGLEVFTAIKFAPAFILKETGLTASKPSGQKPDEFEGLAWLIEEKRPRTVRKFTGTMEHARQNQDLASLTVDAFIHYAFGQSQGQCVFADMQGTPTRVNDMDGYVLFDPMTHTLTGDSGVGDFGKEGMERFFLQHVCGRICKQMTMDKTYPLEFMTVRDDMELDSDTELEPEVETTAVTNSK